MATSKVQAANMALQRLGAKRIESLTQDHPNARSMNAAFDRIRDALLRSYTWSFAIKRASIAADGDDPTWGDWNQYGKPNDFVKLIRDDESGARVDFKIEGGFILSRNDSPLEIRYVASIEDPNVWDALFFEAFYLKLAHHCCEEVTQSTSKKAKIQDELDTAIALARQVGAIEKEAEDAGEDDWILARN